MSGLAGFVVMAVLLADENVALDDLRSRLMVPLLRMGLRVEGHWRPHVTLARKLHKRALQLQIIDNGPGIPAAIREQIFYPLVTGRPEGTGLGLTLAQAYVQQHQGSIECDSEPGRTCFTLLFPFEREREAHQMPYKANEGK